MCVLGRAALTLLSWMRACTVSPSLDSVLTSIVGMCVVLSRHNFDLTALFASALRVSIGISITVSLRLCVVLTDSRGATCTQCVCVPQPRYSMSCVPAGDGVA